MNWLNKIPKKDYNLAWRIIVGEAVVIALDHQPKKGEKIQIFNKTATRIWELADGNNTVSDIIKAMVEEYHITPKRAEEQIKGFLFTLSKKNLLRQ